MSKNTFIPTTKGLVSAHKSQDFTSDQKTQARTNIAAAASTHTHSADDIVSGALAKARQHAQTVYLDGSGQAFANPIAVQGVTVGAGAGTNSLSVAVGALSSVANVSGTANTTIGYESNGANTTGERNVAVGTYCQQFATGSYNVAVGYMANRQNSGTDNVALGYMAGATATGMSASTIVGSNAGASLTTGGNNVVVGNASGYLLTTGDQNVLVGAEAGKAATTMQFSVVIGTYALLVGNGSGNTVIGYQAASNNTTGSEICAFGNQAGVSNVTGVHWTAIGSKALDVSLGSYNTGIGSQAGYLLSAGDDNTLGGRQCANGSTSSWSGNRNTAFGAQALYSFGSTGINDNTAVGYRAGYAVTSGTTNIFVGSGSGRQVTTGSNNTIIGFETGDGLTTGSGNVIIGKTSGVSSALTNHVIINDGAGNAKLKIDGSANATLYGNVTQDVGAGSNTSYQLGTASSNVAFLTVGGGGSIARWADGHTYLSSASSASNPQLVLFSSNAVAIGTNTPPTTKFHVEGTSKFTGAATFSNTAKLGDFTVATLPSAASNAGYEANVTDSSVTTFGSTVAGSGSSRVKVYSNGTNWTVQAA
jgi:hypothetical protein